MWELFFCLGISALASQSATLFSFMNVFVLFSSSSFLLIPYCESSFWGFDDVGFSQSGGFILRCILLQRRFPAFFHVEKESEEGEKAEETKSGCGKQ